MMQKKVFIGSFLVVVLGVALYFFIALVSDGVATEVELYNEVSFSFDEPDRFDDYSVSEEARHGIAEDTIHQWEIALSDEDLPAEFTLTIREFRNGDFVLFTRLENPSEELLQIGYSVDFHDQMALDSWFYPDDDFEREHDSTLGVDPTSYPVGLKTLENQNDQRFDIFSGKNYISQELIKEYEDGSESVLRDLIDEKYSYLDDHSSEVDALDYEIISEGNDISEHWFMLSRSQLFEDKTVLNEWMDYSLENYKQVNKWYTDQGALRKIPWSIEPYTEMGFGRNLGTMREKVVMDRYKSTGERYFYNIVRNSLVDLLNYRDEGQDVWKTEYTSTWLKEQWETTAPFVDTRHNENIALFFMDAAEEFEEPELMEYASYYGDFLFRQVEEENTIILDDEHFYIADYEDVYGSNTTHASLNHILGEMNYLLNYYMQTGEEDYLSLAMDLRAAVEFTGREWIRDNGDLWYQINPDLTFDGNDYTTLTLEDLLFAQRNFELLNIDQSSLFFDLIQSKTTYLTEENVSLPQYIIYMLEDQGHLDSE